MDRISILAMRMICASALMYWGAAFGASVSERPYEEGSARFYKGLPAPGSPAGTPAPPPWVEPSALQSAVPDGLSDSPAIVKVTPASESIGLYKTLVVAIDLSTAYNNPFDPVDIRVDMLVKVPSGEDILQPCFFRSGASGNSRWEARFAPRKLGAHTYTISVIRQGATETSETFTVQSGQSDSPGFLHMDPDSWWGFRFDNGKRFRGVGENFGWEGGKYNFRNTLPLLKANKVNFIRTWEGPGRFGLEHFQQFNRYNTAVADKIDTVMQLAEENGIHVMAAFDPHIYYYTKADYWAPGIIRWNENPYKTDRGGPCAAPACFFTNAAAKAAYKNRLRYTVARWGSSTHLAVWEFWNEVDHLVASEGVTTAMLGSWHAEMSEYLRTLDPYDHIITSSLSHNDYREMWGLAGIEFTQRHLYGSSDGLAGTFAQYENNYRKPFVSGEFSLHWTGTTAATPVAFEREVHMALWRGMFMQSPILPMTWWWDFHADQGDYFHFARARDMVEKMVEGDGKLERAALAASPELEALAAKTPLGAFAWVRNKQGGTVNGTSITLNGIANLNYDVRTFDTWTGVWGAAQAHAAANGTLKVNLPTLGADKDMGLWLQARIPVAARPGRIDAGLTLSSVKQQDRRLEIALTSAEGKAIALTLVDVTGRIAFQTTLEPGRAGASLVHVVELPALRSGLYVLGLVQGGARLRRPLVLP